MIQQIPKILIVDDRPENLVALENILDEYEVKILKATSGREALSLILKHEFALILLDVQMPEMDGFETAELIRSREKSSNIPIIFITAISHDKHHIYQGYDKGAVDYMSKPLDEHVLCSKIGVFLELYRNRKFQEELLIQLKEAQAELEEQNEKLSFLAMHDSLTMINNRLAFDREGKKIFQHSKENGEIFALFLIDIDDFKWINDKFGHLTGDSILRTVAEVLKESVTPNDFIARIGGDEFAIILKNIRKIEDTGIIAEKILNKFNTPINLPEKDDISINVSIGISCFSPTLDNFSTIFKQADVALYKAKYTGKKRFEFYSKLIRDLYLEKKDIIYELRKALENKEYLLHYQPIVDIKKNEIVGLETLIRWRNQNLGNISPSKFIPIAEEIGIINDIGDWVIDNACQQISRWEKMGIKNLFYTINISPTQLNDESFTKKLSSSFKKHNIDPTIIELEITESGISSKYSSNLETCILNIDASKMSISIDDFGTGYSSLSRLGALPINTLKIDSSFFFELNTVPKNISIIKSIISLAKNLSMKTIAEGIETREHVDFLIKNKCFLAQGFYFYKPMSQEKITEILVKENNIL